MRFFEYKWNSDCNLQFNNEEFRYLVKVMPMAKKIDMYR
jgi:phage I-like protein